MNTNKQTKIIDKVDKVYNYLMNSDTFTTLDIKNLLGIDKNSVSHLLSIVESRKPILFEKQFLSHKVIFKVKKLGVQNELTRN